MGLTAVTNISGTIEARKWYLLLSHVADSRRNTYLESRGVFVLFGWQSSWRITSELLNNWIGKSEGLLLLFFVEWVLDSKKPNRKEV